MEPDPANRNPGKALQRLWREDPEAVTAAHDALRLARGEGEMEDDGSGRHGLRAERMRELHRPLSARSKPGLTVADVAAMMGLRKETVARLLEHHGYLELAPYGRDHQRRLVTAEAYAAGHGHNVNSSGSRSKRLDGAARSAPFAVFYPEHVASIVWTLGVGSDRGICRKGGEETGPTGHAPPRSRLPSRYPNRTSGGDHRERG